MRLFVLLVRWLTDRIAPTADAFEDDRPWGHTLTLTVGPKALDHQWRCYEPSFAACRAGREEADGCLFIERIGESASAWYALTYDGWTEEFPPMQVDFIEQAGEPHWTEAQVYGS